MFKEILNTEEEYVRDLRILNQVFKESLKEQISSEMLEKIFVKVDSLFMIHKQFLENLFNATKLSELILYMNNLLSHPDMEYSYRLQCSDLVISLNILSKQRRNHPEIDILIKQAESNEECRKLDIGHFLSRPFARITRYVVLLENLEKKQNIINSDLSNDLKQLIKKWKHMLNRLNYYTGKSAQRFNLKLCSEQLDVSHLYHGEQMLECIVELDLMNQDREIICQGPLNISTDKRKSIQQCLTFLFDHVILFTIPKNSSDNIFNVLMRPPVWLKNSFIEDNQESLMFSLIQMNMECTEYLFSFNTEFEKKTWMDAIKNAIKHKRESICNRIGTLPILDPISDIQLDIPLSIHITQCQLYYDNNIAYCYYSTREQLSNNDRNKQAIGGLFFVSSSNNQSDCIMSFKHKYIQQFQFLDCNSLVYLLSNKKLYHIQYRSNAWIGKKKLGSSVSIFKIGRIYDKSILIIVKPRQTWTCLVKLYQIIDKPRNNGNTCSFKILRRIYVGSPIDGLEIIRDKLILSCTFGFELIDPDSLTHQTLLDPQCIIGNYSINNPMRIFMIESGSYFVCFQKCGFWINGKGERILLSNGICSWNGIPIEFEYRGPWLIVFTKRFIELWNVGDVNNLFNICIPLENSIFNLLVTTSFSCGKVLMLNSIIDPSTANNRMKLVRLRT